MISNNPIVRAKKSFPNYDWIAACPIHDEHYDTPREASIVIADGGKVIATVSPEEITVWMEIQCED